jgi:hypothetical protein
VAQPQQKIVYAYNNWSGIVWVPHLSERIHSIGVKIEPNIPWIIREVLHKAKAQLFPLVGVLHPRYHGTPVTAQKSRYGQFPQVANGWGTMHPVLDTAPPLKTKEEGQLT